MSSTYIPPTTAAQGARIIGEGLSDTSGPGPDGTCPHGDAPCAPRRLHAQLRGRIALFAAALVLALVVVLSGEIGRAHV